MSRSSRRGTGGGIDARITGGRPSPRRRLLQRRPATPSGHNRRARRRAREHANADDTCLTCEHEGPLRSRTASNIVAARITQRPSRRVRRARASALNGELAEPRKLEEQHRRASRRFRSPDRYTSVEPGSTSARVTAVSRRQGRRVGSGTRTSRPVTASHAVRTDVRSHVNHQPIRPAAEA
jgi:hypothetical protein